MGVDRQFLGWDGAALPRAAAVLCERFGDALDRPVVAVPASRAGRRLLEILVEAGGGALSAVPGIETAGELPERLYEPARPIADDWTAVLARVAALRRVDGDVLHRIVPTPPEGDDLGAWWLLAQRLSSVHDDLAAAATTLDDVIERIRRLKLDDTALDRLVALRGIERAYHDALESLGLIDRQHARLDAIARRACRCERPIVLVCVGDLSAQLKQMIAQLDAPVLALVHAPPEAAEGFDEYGGLVAEYWRKQSPPIDDGQLRIVDRPIDQARQVVLELSGVASPSDDVTVGLGDPRLASTVKRAIGHAGAAARYAAGRPMARSRPAMLLRALGAFATARRFDDFAALLRHPDAAGYVDQPDAVEDWLSLLDRYANDHLQGRLFGEWLGEAERQEKLKHLWDRVNALLPAGDERRPLPQWAQPIADALHAVYAGRELSRHARDDHDLVTALSGVGDALRGLSAIDGRADVTPRTTFAQAVGLVLQQLRDKNVPEPGGESAVELMDYLELPLDDAPQLILTGVNEGHLPGARVADPWLPDSMRRALGLPDNAYRFARDLYLLSAMLHSRAVTLIAGRLNAEGEPMPPSRLLLACDDGPMVRRVGAFYRQQDDESRHIEPPLLLSPGSDDHFLIPPPPVDAPKRNQLSVTAFRDYLACPYRFYLRHILKLRALDDRAGEMDALAFGGLAHDVLQAFARSDVKDSDNTETINRFLSRRLDELVRQRYGPEPRMALRLQVEQLRSRLMWFAIWQAQARSDGWRIEHAEQNLRAELVVDDQPFTITGRVDRIDRHKDFGYRILDYKTGDTGRSPDQTHRRGPRDAKEWIDLQLPLYHELCAPLGVTGDVALGYINLPKKLEDTGLKLADWDDDALADARQQRDAVIRGVRRGVYWPPSEPPQYDDDYRAICADLAFDRGGLIARSGEGR